MNLMESVFMKTETRWILTMKRAGIEKALLEN
jgi:hypothetical protein